MSTPYSVLMEPRQDILPTMLATNMARIINNTVCNNHQHQPKSLQPAATQKEINLATKEAIKREPTIPEDLPIKEKIGKLGLMWPCTYALQHPAMPLLQKFLTKGCPADCSLAWTKAQIETAIQHGLHKSALSPAARAALRAEALTKVQ